MSGKKTEQKHVQMIVTKTHDQPEAKTLLVATTTTTSGVETTNKYDTRIVQGNRDNWSNRVVYLLSIIGFVVDLGRFSILNIFMLNFISFLYRQCLAFSNNLLSKWRWCFSCSLFRFFISCWSSL
jgi:hypothetical protein